MKRKHWILTISILLIGALAYAYYQYNRKPASLKGQEAEISISADSLLSAFESDEAQANIRFLDKIVSIEGQIEDIEAAESVTTVSLITANPMSMILCQMEGNPTDLEIGQEVRLKGKCTGYLFDVVLTKCVIDE